MNATELLGRWLEAITRHDAAALAGMMTEDHVFVDSLAKRIQGAKTMEAGWRGYFGMCPDYWVRVESMMTAGDEALLAGESGGTIAGEIWRTPAAWRARIRDGRIAEWQVFADNKPVYEILERRKGEQGYVS